MSYIDNPPTYYFSTINFNPAFYNTSSNALTQSQADNLYLKFPNSQASTENINGVMNFNNDVNFNYLNTPPHCSIPPTQGNDLCNKQYVDSQAPLTSFQLFANYSETYNNGFTTYYKLSDTEVYSPQTVPFSITAIGNQLIASFANSLSSLNLVSPIPPGNWTLNTYCNVSTIADQSHIGIYYEIFGISSLGVETVITTSSLSTLLSVVSPSIGVYSNTITLPSTVITAYTDIGIKIYINSNTVQNRTGNIYFQNTSSYTSVLTSFATTQASNILASNNTWTGTNAFNAATTLNSTLNLTSKATSNALSLTTGTGLTSGLTLTNTSTNTGNILISQTNSSANTEIRNVFGSTGSIILSPSGTGAFLLNSSKITSYLPYETTISTPTVYTPLTMIDGTSNNRIGFALNYTAGSLNNLVQAGDNLIFAGSAQNVGSMVIGPWASTNIGIRMSSLGTTNIQAQTSMTLGTSGTTRLTVGTAQITSTLPISGITSSTSDNSTSLATTAYVQNQMIGATQMATCQSGPFQYKFVNMDPFQAIQSGFSLSAGTLCFFQQVYLTVGLVVANIGMWFSSSNIGVLTGSQIGLYNYAPNATLLCSSLAWAGTATPISATSFTMTSSYTIPASGYYTICFFRPSSALNALSTAGISNAVGFNAIGGVASNNSTISGLSFSSANTSFGSTPLVSVNTLSSAKLFFYIL